MASPYAGSGRRDESPGPWRAFPLHLRRARHPGSPFSVPEQTRTSPSFPPEHGKSPDGALRTGQAGREDYEDGATAEFDAESGLLNPGLQWLGSGIIEWVKAACFLGNPYDTMDAEATAVPHPARRRDNGSGLPWPPETGKAPSTDWCWEEHAAISTAPPWRLSPGG